VIRAIALLLGVTAIGSAAVSVAQEKACNTAGAAVASLACSFDVTPTATRAVVASCTYYNFNNTIVATVTDNQGNPTYTEVATLQNAAHSQPSLHVVPNIASTGTFTVTCAVSTNTYIVLHIYELSGAATSSIVDASGTNAVDAGSSTGTVSTSGATTVADSIAIAAFAFQSAGTNTAGTGYTLLQSTTNVGTTVMGDSDEYKVLSATGSQTAEINFGISQANGYAAVIATFKASGGGGGSPDPPRRRIIQ
jgi:hypothetical protein